MTGRNVGHPLFFRNFHNDKLTTKQGDDLMIACRFMSFSEYRKLRKGEMIHGRSKSYHISDVQREVSFFPLHQTLDYIEEVEALKPLIQNVCNMHCCIVVQFFTDKLNDLREGTGYYQYSHKDSIKLTEYYTSRYSMDDIELLCYELNGRWFLPKSD